MKSDVNRITACFSKARAFADRYKCDFVDLDNIDLQIQIMRQIPVSLMLRYLFVPVSEMRDGRLAIVLVDPTPLLLLEEISLLLKRPILARVAPEVQILAVLRIIKVNTLRSDEPDWNAVARQLSSLKADGKQLVNSLPRTSTTKSILIVEDRQELLNVFRSTLEMVGYNVVTAKSGEDALSQALSYSNLIDVVLTDVILPPFISSAELAAKLSIINPAIAVVYMSGYSKGQVGFANITKVPGLFLAKPFSTNQLLTTINKAICSMKGIAC